MHSNIIMAVEMYDNRSPVVLSVESRGISVCIYLSACITLYVRS